jgi:hypothetical protein
MSPGLCRLEDDPVVPPEDYRTTDLENSVSSKASKDGNCLDKKDLEFCCYKNVNCDMQLRGETYPDKSECLLHYILAKPPHN